jgi:Tol biopolymer transport system component
VILITRAENPNPACLNIESEHLDILDPKTGSTFTKYTDLQYNFMMVNLNVPQTNAWAFSPDGTRVAYFGENTNSGIKVTTLPIPVLDVIRKDQGMIDTLSSQILWSPDGQWIASHWKADDGDHLAVTNADGVQRNSMMIDTRAGEGVELKSWSPDDRYIAIFNVNSDRDSGRLRFLSVPDLQVIDPNTEGDIIASDCEFPPSASYGFECNIWAAQGHQAAYAIETQSDSNALVTLNVGESKPQRTVLSPALLHTMRFSPDSTFIAIASFNVDQPTQTTNGQLEVYGKDGSIYHNLGAVAFAGLGGPEDTPIAEMVWSPDGKLLFYLRHGSDSKIVLMSFQPDTNERHLLYDNFNPDNNDYTITVSKDDQFIAVAAEDVSDSGNSVYLVHADGSGGHEIGSDRGSYSPMQWSLDGSMFAYIGYSFSSTGSVVHVYNRDGMEMRRYATLPNIDTFTWTACD